MKGIFHLSRNRNWESAGTNGHALRVMQKGFNTSFRRLSIQTHHSSRRHRRPRESTDILLAFCVTHSHSLVVLPPFRHVFFLFTTALPPWQSRSRWNQYCGCHNHYRYHYSRHRVHRLCNRNYQYRFWFIIAFTLPSTQHSSPLQAITLHVTIASSPAFVTVWARGFLSQFMDAVAVPFASLPYFAVFLARFCPVYRTIDTLLGKTRV